ncbi:hydroxyethylthiazole kinase [Chryseobacterium indoltheticum]|uniref:hydroxyethylthiazole kinase n=1 Tax=Chryseobacterium indoltheticum TaxID=254 RepID=UPI0019112DD6|nr:hydroxyethylthiazole kinase [Chryseobacterium indoltheticum]QQQ29171.1 hydroxyethylthiazole kinase [Chryseobacterium indoltheticum]
MENNLWQHILHVRNTSPLVHNITNYVVMNNTANALLAVGASPIMAHAKPEVLDMVKISNAMVINIGTLDEYWEEAMLLAAKNATLLQKPWILDPVGAGATAYRDTVLSTLLKYHPTAIRGNASEIIALANANAGITKGVDSTAQSTEALEAAKTMVQNCNSVVCISGETDIIVSQTLKYLKYAETAIVVENILHESYFKDFGLNEKGEIQPACHHYIHFLKSTAALDSVEIAMASVLPCFWIYKKVGDHIYNHLQSENNPYQRWIDTYGGEEFADAVEQAINLCDEVASEATAAVREKMTEAFITSSRMEYHFWEAAYDLKKWA